MSRIEPIMIDGADRDELERLVRDRNTAQKVVWRAQIVLLAADGLQAGAIAAATGKSQLTVRRWRRRFVAKGVEGLLKDASRPPRRKPLTAEKIAEVVHMTLHAKPPNATHWSVRSMAAAAGLSASSIQRIWSAHGLKPHLVKTFKLSRDPNFAAKVQDVVGLYLDPPEKALVLSLDEKSQILLRQAQDEGAGSHPAGLADEEGAGRNLDPRLQTPWRDDAVRRPRRRDRQGHRSVHAQASSPGVAQIPAGHRPGHAQAARPAPDRRQLRHPQASDGQGVAGQASPFPHALYPDIRILAQPGRALLRPDHRQPHPPRRVQQRHRTGGRHYGLSRSAQRTTQAIRLDQVRRRNPRKGRPRETSVRVTTLVSALHPHPIAPPGPPFPT